MNKNHFKEIAVIIPFITILIISCQPQTNVKSPAENLTENISQSASLADNMTTQLGFDIPEGTIAKREPTYDDPGDAPGGLIYRSGLRGKGEIEFDTRVENITSVALGDGYYVWYRNYIETKAGEIRYNIFDTEKERSVGEWYSSKVKLKLASLPKDIQVKNTGVSVVVSYKILIMLEIPPQVKPGNYNIEFLIFINEKYYGTLPCTIHVTE